MFLDEANILYTTNEQTTVPRRARCVGAECIGGQSSGSDLTVASRSSYRLGRSGVEPPVFVFISHVSTTWAIFFCFFRNFFR